MKNAKYALTASLLFLTASSCLLNGCSKKEDSLIVSINDKELYMEDFLYDIYQIESENNRLDEYYQNKLNCSYWDYEHEGKTIREAAKSSLMTQVVMQEILADQATQKGLSLSQKEIKENETVIDQLYATKSENSFNSIGMTRSVLTKTLTKKTLCKKYYQELAKRFKVDYETIRESVNKEHYREYKTECLFAPTVTLEDEQIIPMSQEDIATAYQHILTAKQSLSKGLEFDDILNAENQLTYSSRNFIYGNSNYEETYQMAAIIVNNEEYSDIVSTDYGYYIIHMLDNYSMDQYDKAVQDAIAADEEKQFAKLYNKMKKQYDISINFPYWDIVTLGSITKCK